MPTADVERAAAEAGLRGQVARVDANEVGSPPRVVRIRLPDVEEMVVDLRLRHHFAVRSNPRRAHARAAI